MVRAIPLKPAEVSHLEQFGYSPQAVKDLTAWRSKNGRLDKLPGLTRLAVAVRDGVSVPGLSHLDVSESPLFSGRPGRFYIHKNRDGETMLAWMGRPEHLLRLERSVKTWSVPDGSLVFAKFISTPTELMLTTLQPAVYRDTVELSRQELGEYGRDWPVPPLLALIRYAQSRGKRLTAVHPDDYQDFHNYPGVQMMSDDIPRYYRVALKQAIIRSRGLTSSRKKNFSLEDHVVRFTPGFHGEPQPRQPMFLNRKVVLYDPPAKRSRNA